ncbi:MAG: hypothetical protein ACREEP_17915, partial [Dongiaceae bacterium]
FDRAGLLGLVQDLYAVNKENQVFLHARFSVGADPLAVYKKRIETALFPDWNKPVRIAEAKKAIADYRKAIGLPDGLLELQIYFCEVAMGFSMEYGYMDENYADAIALQFEAALQGLTAAPQFAQSPGCGRLDKVRLLAADVGYGLHDEMDYMMEQAGFAP